MIDSALFDVECPLCGAGPLELCTVGSRYMESTVHGPRRVRAGVVIEATPVVPTDPTKCRAGKHAWTAENTFVGVDGRGRCRPCRDARQRRRNNATHRYGGMHCSKGHEYTPENTYMPPSGTRHCVTCRRNNRKKARK